MSRPKVCHFTSVHPVFDTRIFRKECTSLAAAGYNVSLVATNCEAKTVDGIVVVPVPSVERSRLMRMITTAWSTFITATKLDADIYHFHDPEMILYGLILKIFGKKVVYDVHEDVASDILMKDWIPAIPRYFISKVYYYLEQFASLWFDAILPATPHITSKFHRFKHKVFNVNNFPLSDELVSTDLNIAMERAVCFVGAIDCHRGILEMVDAIGRTSGKLILGGRFDPPHIRDIALERHGWGHVEELGQCSREAVTSIFSKSMAGLVLFHPGPNHVNALPNKMFEYMSAGLPVIASNFPLWIDIIEGNKCGICVDPMNVEAIANAIEWIYSHPLEAAEMGKNGRKAVLEKYNWTSEKIKLLDVYENLAS